MEAHVARLEAGMSDIRATLARLEPVLGQVSRDLADVKSRELPDIKASVAKLDGRVSQLPTTIQMIGFIFAVLAVAGVTRYLGI